MSANFSDQLDGRFTVLESDLQIDCHLFASEARELRGHPASRAVQYKTARALARRGLSHLGFPATPLVLGHHGGLTWPDGLVGSVSHTRGQVAVVVAVDQSLLSIGIDVEAYDYVLPPQAAYVGLLAESERKQIAHLQEHRRDIPWQGIFWSAKESLFKASSPHGIRSGRIMDFQVRVSASGALLGIVGDIRAVGTWSFDGQYVRTALWTSLESDQSVLSSFQCCLQSGL